MTVESARTDPNLEHHHGHHHHHHNYCCASLALSGSSGGQRGAKEEEPKREMLKLIKDKTHKTAALHGYGSSRSIVALQAVGVKSVAAQAVFRDSEGQLTLNVAHLGGKDQNKKITTTKN